MPFIYFLEDDENSIATLTPPAEVSTSGGLVSARFAQAATMGDSALQTALAVLETLKNMTYDVETNALEIAEPAESGLGDLELHPSAPPTLTDIDLSVPDFTGDEPVMDPISINNDPLPVQSFSDLPDTLSFNWNEVAYTSDLLTAVTGKLETWLAEGGTGLDAEIEAAIWARAKSRQVEENEAAVNEVLNGFAAKGWNLPQGVMVGALAAVQNRIDRRNVDLNSEIAIEQAKLAQNNTQFAVTSSIQLEGQLMTVANQMRQRAFEAAKAVIDYTIAVFEARVAYYKAVLDAFKVRAEVDIARTNAIVEKFKGGVEAMKAKVEKYKAVLEGLITQADISSKTQALKVDLYEADTKRYSTEVDAIIKSYLGRVDTYKAKVDSAIKIIEVQLQAALQKYGLQSDSVRATAQIASQLAAAALNSVNASASVGYQEGRSDSRSYSRSEGASVSSSNSNVTSHSTNHNYSHSD